MTDTLHREILQELREIKIILHDLHDHVSDFLVVEDDAFEELFKDEQK